MQVKVQTTRATGAGALSRTVDEAALRQSLECFRAITDFLPDIISIFDGEGRLVFNSAAAGKIHGYQAHELEGRSTFDFIHPEDRPSVEAAFGRLLQAPDEMANVQYRYRNADGSYKWMEAFGRNELNNPLIKGVIAISRDITARQQAKAALRQAHDELDQRVRERTAELTQTNADLRRSQEQFQAIADHTPDHILIQDRDLRYRLVINPQLGLTEADMLGKTDQDLFSKADAEHLTGIKKKVLATGRPVHVESSLPNLQGEPVFFEGDYIPKRDAAGRVDGLIGYFRNVTARKRAEAALRESEAQLHAFVQEAPAAIAMFDRNMNYLAVSQRWINDFSRGQSNLVGLNHYQVTPDLPARWKKAHRLGLAGQTHASDEDLWVKPDGSRLWLRWVVRPWRNAGGTIGGILLMAEDVTARKNAEAALRASEARHRALITSAQDAILTLEPPLWKFTSGNPAALKMFRIADEKRLAATAPWELSPVFQPDGRPSSKAAQAMIRKAMRQGKHFFEWQHQRLDGEEFPALVQLTRVELAGRTFLQATVRDFTESKRTAERLAQLDRAKAILAGIDRAIVHLPDQQKLLDEVCRLAVEKGGFKLAWIGMVAPDGSVQPVAQAGATGYLKGVRVVTQDVPEGRGPVGLAIRENRRAVIRDIDQDASMSPWRDRAQQFGLHYAAAFPLRVAGKVTGSFQVYAPRAGFIDESELALLTQVSEDVSFALTTLAGQAARQQAEEALRRSERHLANFFNQAPIGLLWLSASGTILRANQAQLDLLGYPAKDYLGQSFIQFCGEPAAGHELLRRLANRETVRNLPMTRRTRDGTIRHVLVDANSFWSGNQFQYSSIFLRDVTDRVELEKEILQAGERERRRIAQDLHDGLGQLLVGAAYLASNLQDDLAAKARPETRQSRRVMELIKEAIAQTRDLARGLHPVEPEPNGLMVALAALAARTGKLFRVRCRFTCRRPVLITDNAMATHLFRITQEAVTNAIKHGRSGRIAISLTENAGSLKLAIKDDGTGLSSRRRKNSGMGFRIMNYRAGMIGGSLVMQKAADGGTAIVCTAPLPVEAGGHPAPPPGRKKEKRKKD